MEKKLFINKPFRYRYFYATAIIVALNVLVFLAGAVNPRIYMYIQSLGGLSVTGCFHYHFWWQPVSYMFVHANWSHLIFNMLGLLCFGFIVERTIGSFEFLLFYFVCGIFDGLISLLMYRLLGVNTLLVGASGAIYSILLMYAVLFPRSIIRIWGILPVPAPVLVLLYAVVEIVSQFFGQAGVAHLTHLTGFVMAFIYILIRMRVNPVKVWIEAYRRR